MSYNKEVADDKLTYELIGYAIDVHRGLGPHQTEHLYRDGLCAILDDEDIDYQREAEVDVTLRGRKIGSAYVDILILDEVVLELKALKKTTDDHYNQLGRNVHAAGVPRGLLINFGESTVSTRRWVNSAFQQADSDSSAPSQSSEDSEQSEGSEPTESSEQSEDSEPSEDAEPSEASEPSEGSEPPEDSE